MIPQKAPKKRSSERFRELWPDIREMARPRWKVLAVGFGLMWRIYRAGPEPDQDAWRYRAPR